MPLSHLEHSSPTASLLKRRADTATQNCDKLAAKDFGFTETDDAEKKTSPRDGDVDLRQLRHHTKNALQRIISLVLQVPGLRDTPEGEFLLRQLETRIKLSAAVSDALFGLTRTPEPMTDRLRSLSGNLVELLRDPTQAIQIGVYVRGDCPTQLREPVLRVAHELIGNAVKHGMRMRPRGRITVRLQTESGIRTKLTVIDDGGGFHGEPKHGEGLSIARTFATQHGGTISLKSDGRTIASLELPHPW